MIVCNVKYVMCNIHVATNSTTEGKPVIYSKLLFEIALFLHKE